MKTTEYEPTGHLQVRLDDKSRPHAGRSYFVYWVDAAGKHGKKLGPAHVKDSGRKTPRGAVVWRAGDGPKPTRRHLTPKEAKRELDAILRDASRRMSIEPAGTLLDALEGSLTERLRDGKVKANRRPDYEAVHGRLCRDLGGERSIASFDTEELTEYIRGLEAQKFIGPKRARQLRREGTPVEEVRIARWVAFPPEEDPVARRAEMKRVGHMESLQLATQGFAIEQRETRRWATCSPASLETKLKYRDLLGSAFDYAVSKSWIADNPVDDVPRPAGGMGREATLRRTDFYDRDEVARLVAQAPNTLEKAFWLCGCHAGLRLPGEGQGLLWGSVDFRANVVRAQDGWSRGERSTTKTSKTTAIPMTPQLRSALAELKQRDYCVSDDDPVFTCSVKGRPVSDARMRRNFHAAAKRAGLKRITMYNLRHSFGTALAASGRIPNRTIQELMRHRRASTTEVYTAYSPQPDLERQLSTALEPAAVVVMATGAVDDEIPDTEGFRDLRERFLDRLDEQVPAKWLRAVAGLFDDVAREVAEQA